MDDQKRMTLNTVIKTFEHVERARKALSNRQAHLLNNRYCLDCNRDFMPTRSEPCPECGSEDTKIGKTKATCQGCAFKWEPEGLNECKWCHSKNIEPRPKHDKYLDEVALPRLMTEEEYYESFLKDMVHEHPLWPWIQDVKGIAETTIARIIVKTDIFQCNTVSKFWSHCGFGLFKDGTIQKKVKGETISYNAPLQGNCVMAGSNLMRAADSYYDQYLRFKRENEELPIGHCHNRAFRHMVKLFLAHVWEVWRLGEGLEAPRPYAFAILKHADEHYIGPWDMVRQSAGSRK